MPIYPQISSTPVVYETVCSLLGHKVEQHAFDSGRIIWISRNLNFFQRSPTNLSYQTLYATISRYIVDLDYPICATC